MKCQKCAKSATYHITDLDPVTPGKYHEFHLCDEHARQHLTPLEEASEGLSAGDLAKALIGGKAGAGQPREASPADKQVCPLCQISFHEFRNSGRLGCPNDYLAFNRGLLPLLRRSHDGVTRHVGKVPKRPAGPESADALRLRAQLRQAVSREEYEEAARLRDQLRPKDATP